MGTLSYTATVSLDGYAADASGDFQWSAPGDEVFRFHVERMGAVSTEVLGRNTYQLMTYWNAEPEDGSWGEDEREFARRWQGIEHIVVSSTLGPEDLDSPRDRLLPELELSELEQIVRDASGEVEIFGPTTAAAAIRAGMVRDFRFFVVPKVVGGGLRALPADAALDLDLVEQRTYGDTAYLHYARR
ncbi:dihydrofolate reductase family protein [Dietzia aurantiaca]|uniref:dihydrofolate reductase family protein n=1 Tax=Dietzia aurantiaca TaxID=983873 RepID=UPI001E4B412A|nr:dihydrofolate reductase family protein [Dietzia aurantiaca]MCD2262298.1 dihydrofolate reductase family protein [Dietzia aurantiaca]